VRRARYVPWSGRAGAIQHWTFDAAIGNHGDRPRRSPERRRPQKRHGIAGFHQRNDFDDAPQAGIHDHPHFFTGIIDRTHGVGLSLPDRASERLEPGRAHDRGDLVGRQYHPIARVDGVGIRIWNRLRQSRSRCHEREREDAREKWNSLFQDTIPRSDYLRSSPDLIASAKRTAVNETAQVVCVCLQR
jgi:hypothetical protein